MFCFSFFVPKKLTSENLKNKEVGSRNQGKPLKFCRSEQKDEVENFTSHEKIECGINQTLLC